jgi:hypothetical protein
MRQIVDRSAQARQSGLHIGNKRLEKLRQCVLIRSMVTTGSCNSAWSLMNQ